MKVTLHDIAKKSGYSVSTVSRVLNGSDKISSKTQEKIVAVALELDFPIYKINQPIGKYRAPNLMLVTDFHDSEFYAVYFSGFAQAAYNQNYRLSLTSITNPRQEVIDTLMMLVASGIDGIILFMPELDRNDYLKIIKKLPDNYPIVSNALIESPVITTVTFDGYSGGYQAATYFEQQGYDTIGLIKGPAKKAESRFRSSGFKDYITHSPSMDLSWEYEGDFTFESGIEAFKNFMTLKNPPKAVFSTNDMMSIAFLIEAKQAGIEIPKDVALLSFDDLPLCQRTHPKISSIKTDFCQLANRTLRVLIDQTQLNGSESLKQGVLSQIPVSISLRESS